MLKKRIIPCLDVKDGRTVKGINFVGLRDAGDPIELAKKYAEGMADELVFLDITATQNKRKTVVELVQKVAREIDIPFTVGGGVQSVEDAYEILRAGADKIAVNSAAVKNPSLIRDISEQFGKQCVVAAIDAKREAGVWNVYISGGKIKTELELFSWAKKLEELGAGEILFTSMNNDGTKNGFANDALKELNSMLTIPIIASGGAGKKEDFLETFNNGKSDAALAASVFHYDEIEVKELKEYLKENNVPVRL